VFEYRGGSWYRVVIMEAGVDKSREEKIEQLKRYFEHRDDVVMAFLFGSQAAGRPRQASDWDIGVYFRNEEENRAQEQKMWSALEAIVKRDVDLVVLNRAPVTIAWNVMRLGIPLSILDRNVYLSTLLKTSHEANAWFDTARDYHRVFERSASLSEIDRGRLEKTLQFLEQEVKDFRIFRPLSWREYADEHKKTKKREVERWVEQLMNAVIDTAELILASERRMIPETYRDMVSALGTIEPFDESDACERLAGFAKLRNLLAHEYLDYRFKEITAFLAETEPLFIALLGHVKQFLDERADEP